MIRALAMLTAIGIATPVGAQLLQDEPTVAIPPEPPLTTARSIFARDREVAVADRMLPAFSAQAISVGDIDLFPGLSIGGLFTSNVFANNADKHADVALVVRPELTARTSAGPYQVTAFARGDLRRYAGNGSENTEEGQAGLRGSVAVGPLSTVALGVSYGSLINPRYSPDTPIDAAKPLEYRALDAYASGVFEGSSTRVILRVDAADLRFRDTPSRRGGTIFTRDRDRTRMQGLLRVERAISPAFSLYGAGAVNTIDYRFPTTIDGTATPVSRDSKGYGLYAGSSFELTSILRGDVRAGYMRQNFDLAGPRPISGFGTLGNLVYFPNRLWTFTLNAESSVQDSGVPGTGGVLHRGGSLRADHELRRYIIASIEGGYFHDTYRGLPRRDSLPYADVGVTYLSRSHWNARVGYRYLSRDCSCAGGVAEFDDHRATLTLTFQN